MSCIYKYKGKKYSEEQFKEHFINNKNEFATSIAKNKDVIDSFKRKMESIDYVFSQSPELASIGSKAQYLQYLSTIFPNSKVKDIVYHGTEKFEGDVFDKKYLGKKTNNKSETGFYFTSDFKSALESYATIFDIDEYGQEIPFSQGKVIPALLNISELNDDNNFIENDSLGIFYKVFKVFEPEQIHVIGSKNDINGFKDFMSFENSEFSKYGTYQQFRDFITSKFSIEIENRLIETGKINRVC